MFVSSGMRSVTGVLPRVKSVTSWPCSTSIRATYLPAGRRGTGNRTRYAGIDYREVSATCRAPMKRVPPIMRTFMAWAEHVRLVARADCEGTRRTDATLLTKATEGVEDTCGGAREPGVRNRSRLRGRPLSVPRRRRTGARRRPRPHPSRTTIQKRHRTLDPGVAGALGCQ